MENHSKKTVDLDFQGGHSFEKIVVFDGTVNPMGRERGGGKDLAHWPRLPVYIGGISSGSGRNNIQTYKFASRIAVHSMTGPSHVVSLHKRLMEKAHRCTRRLKVK